MPLAQKSARQYQRWPLDDATPKIFDYEKAKRISRDLALYTLGSIETLSTVKERYESPIFISLKLRT